MKRKKIIAPSNAAIIAFLFIGTLAALAQFDKKLYDLYDADFSKEKFRAVKNEAFGFGEKFYYKVGYKFITAGYGYFKILSKPTYFKGRMCYDAQFGVRSLKKLDFLYKVRDNYRSLIDVKGIFPWYFEQHIREGGYKRDFRAVFDQKNHYAYAVYKNKVKKYAIPPYARDIVSAYYYVRTLDLSSFPKDTIIKLHNFYKDSTYVLGVKFHGKETVEVPAGKFRCVVVEPVVLKGGLFRNIGSIYVWLTDDERKMPVKVGAQIIIGFVGAELYKYEGVRGKIDAKIR